MNIIFGKLYKHHIFLAMTFRNDQETGKPVHEKLISRDFSREFLFIASRSSGPGGQHINKVSSRIELRFNIPGSQLLLEEEKDTLLNKLAGRISKDGFLILSSQAERSQHKNKARVIERFYKLIERTLKPVKNRRLTQPSASSIAKRLEKKHIHSEKKVRRRMTLEE